MPKQKKELLLHNEILQRCNVMHGIKDAVNSLRDITKPVFHNWEFGHADDEILY